MWNVSFMWLFLGSVILIEGWYGVAVNVMEQARNNESSFPIENWEITMDLNAFWPVQT